MLGRSSRLVVLGAGGFVGRGVVARARAIGVPVVPVTSSEVDLSSPAAVETLGPSLSATDVVVHVAGRVPTRSPADLRLNLAIAENSMRLVEKSGLSHQVIVSSDAVYGSVRSLVDGESKVAPDTIHGVMSLAREMVLSGAQGTTSVILRSAPIYGAGDTHNSYGPNRFFRDAADRGLIEVFGGGLGMRDHVYVEDVAEAAVFFRDIPSDLTLNVASGFSASFKSVAEQICLVFPEARIKFSGSEGRLVFRHYTLDALRAQMPTFEPVQLSEGVRRMYEALTTT